MTGPRGKLTSINVGMPRTYPGNEACNAPGGPMTPAWTTGFFKEPVAGPAAVELEGIVGDGQADRRHHGGIDKAVLAYSADHYAAWREELFGDDVIRDGRVDDGPLGLVSRSGASSAFEMPWGAFGENLSIRGLNEADVCIGDEFVVREDCNVGDSASGALPAPSAVRLQVSQPRQPCWKLARRWNRPDLPKRVIATGRTGWYLRVLLPGVLQSGMTMELAARPHPAWTIARCNDALYRQTEDRAGLCELFALTELSDAWKRDLV